MKTIPLETLVAQATPTPWPKSGDWKTETLKLPRMVENGHDYNLARHCVNTYAQLVEAAQRVVDSDRKAKAELKAMGVHGVRDELTDALAKALHAAKNVTVED